MSDINSLIKEVNNRGYKYIKCAEIDVQNNNYAVRTCYRKIVRSDSKRVISVSNLIKQRLDVIRYYPSEGSYEMRENGYLEKVDCGVHGTRFVEVTFLKDLPWLKSQEKNS